jgi:hypothetical protein
MQTISGILRIRESAHRKGNSSIEFTDLPRQNERRGDAIAKQIILNVNGRGLLNTESDEAFNGFRFVGFPSYMVHIREWVQEDRTSAVSGGGEMDEYVLNSNIDSRRLNISWDLGDNGRIKEIGFICMGFPDN